MRLGILPSQQRLLQQALKKARKFDDFRGRTRRGLLLTALGGLGCSVSAFLAGRAVGGGGDREPSRQGATANALRRLATGPLADLVSAYPTFLLLLERAGSDTWGFAGFARLVDAAVTRQDATLARHLRESSASLSKELEPLAQLLEPLARR